MSRDLKLLRPEFFTLANQMLQLAVERDLDMLVYATYRDAAEQSRLYRRGRNLEQIREKAQELQNKWGRPDLAQLLWDVGPQHGGRVTNAGPGQSMHQYGLALDAVPMRDGKPVWGTSDQDDMKLWQAYGSCVREAGLVWSGDWTSFREYPHCQMPGYKWQDLIREPQN